MVVFGRFRKPKSPQAFGSPEEDDYIPPQAPSTPHTFTSTSIRNFSYPTSIASCNLTPTFPGSATSDQSDCGLPGDICSLSLRSFSPGSPTRACATGLEDPFFSKNNQTQYTLLGDQENENSTPSRSPRPKANITPSVEAPKAREKQRRSALLSLSASQIQNTSLFSRSADKAKPRYRQTEAFRTSLGDHIFPQKASVTARLNRNSLGQHKAAASFDASRFFQNPSTSPDLPPSNTGIPVFDNRLTHARSKIGPSPLSSSAGDGTTVDPVEAALAFDVQPNPQTSKMSSNHRKSASKVTYEDTLVPTGGRGMADSTSEPNKRTAKDGKGRWFSQIKDWVSVSEPSTQALKQHKKDTYRRAGVALDDPRAGAKLHVPAATLPPDAIRPSGPGPEPEEIARKKAEQKKRLRASYNTGASRSSRSSTSQHSSLSSLPSRELKDGT